MSLLSATRPPARHARRKAPGLLAALTLALWGSLAAQAGADVGSQIIERCTHNQSLSGFSQQDYRRALKEMPTEVSEYSDCGELIRKAELAAAGGGGGSAGGGGAGAGVSPSSPIAKTAAEQHSLEVAHHSGGAPVAVGPHVIRPGVVHADIASVFNSLPASLLAALAILLAGILTIAGGAIRKRILDARNRD